MNKLKADLCLRDETIDKLKMEMNSLLKTDLLRKQIKNITFMLKLFFLKNIFKFGSSNKNLLSFIFSLSAFIFCSLF
jgi:hypothetical protein